MDRLAAARAIDAFLAAIGRDPASDPELRSTGERVAAAYIDELCSGYAVDVGSLLAANLLPAGGGDGGVVTLRDVPVATTCPHHLMAGTGTATVAYAPRASLVGVGVLARVVDAYARRLSLQEEIGEHVVAVLQKHLEPRWVGCRIVMTHTCMTARGERSHGARLVTLAVRAPDGEARREALRVLEGGAGS